MKNGTILADELAVANAHTLGATPWQRADYIRKFRTLSEGIVADAEVERFLAAVQRLPELGAGELHQLELYIPPQDVQLSQVEGIFNFGLSGKGARASHQTAALTS